jgi:hypothetical protein
MTTPMKPLGGKAYGHIAHLPGSRMGPGDHHCHEGQARICTERARDRHDTIIVQEKLDGSCVSVARIAGAIVPLIRAGYPAGQSHYRHHHLFHAWAWENQDRFLAVLKDGERLVGEWLALAHGSRYALPHEPFVVFDLMRGGARAPYAEFELVIRRADFIPPRLIHIGGPFRVAAALDAIAESGHGCLDPVEGAVWRVEREGRVDFLAKYVRPDKVDGCYLPEVAGCEPVWNWLPDVVTG